MTATALFLCGLALVAATPAAYQGNQQNQNQQQNLSQLFVNVQQPNYNQDQAQYGNAFNPFQQLNNFNNQYAVKQFWNSYKQGLLPRGQVFNYNNPNQLQQAIQLFDVFYFAKDYDTFYQAAAWARDRVNEGQFVYALSVAILKRQDTQGVALPPQSEVNPNLYVNAQAIQHAQNQKQQGQQSASVRSSNTNNYQNNQRQQQQQNQQQQQQSQQYNPFYNQDQNNQNQNQNNQNQNQNNQNQNQNNENQDQNNQNQNQNNQYQNQNQNPNQYKNQNQDQNQNQYNQYEGRVAYYNEDVNLNQQFAYNQLNNPSWFQNNQKYNQKTQNQQNGENFYYYLQQALARYNLERYSNDLPNVQPFQFNQPIQPGYNPQLQYPNGQAVPARPNNYALQNNANPNDLRQLQNLDQRIADAVDAQQVQGQNGDNVALNAQNGIEVLGQIVQGNSQNANNQYYTANNGQYSYFDFFRKVVGSIVDPNNQQQNAPGAIQNYNAAQRDPVFYQIVARIVNYFQNFKNQIQPYKQEQLNFPGIQVQSVQVDKLNTYFDNAQVDLYNAINYQQGEQAQNYQYKAQQQQLNNQPFNYQINVNSDKDTNAIVRVFIGPKYNAQGQQKNLEQARQNFVEIDRFVAKLKNGQNQIQRNSQQSTRFVQQQANTRSLNQAQQNQYQFQQNQDQQQNTFPQNLILPKGSQNGQQYVFAVAVNEYQQSQNYQNQNQQNQNQNQQNQGQNQNQPQDNRPQGFPFDRQVNEDAFQNSQNIRFQQVKVYNKNQGNNNYNNNNKEQ